MDYTQVLKVLGIWKDQSLEENQSYNTGSWVPTFGSDLPFCCKTVNLKAYRTYKGRSLGALKISGTMKYFNIFVWLSLFLPLCLPGLCPAEVQALPKTSYIKWRSKRLGIGPIFLHWETQTEETSQNCVLLSLRRVLLCVPYTLLLIRILFCLF